MKGFRSVKVRLRKFKVLVEERIIDDRRSTLWRTWQMTKKDATEHMHWHFIPVPEKLQIA